MVDRWASGGPAQAQGSKGWGAGEEDKGLGGQGSGSASPTAAFPGTAVWCMDLRRPSNN